MQKQHMTAAALLAALALASTVRAGTVLILSDLSSDETIAAELNGILEFSVADGSLLLTVTNETFPGSGFDIDAIFFNATPSVSDLLLAPTTPGWTILTDQRADGFGTFDFSLTTSTGNDPAEIGPQESFTFHFDILGTGPFLDSDFTTQFSRIPPGSVPALAATKFVNGPGDDSAFGAVIPEPVTGLLTLIGVGLACLGRRRAV